MSDVSNSVDRRLFVGGERLRIDVDLPPSGGGLKFEPQTPMQAQELLLPMVQSVVQSAATLSPSLRGERIYIEARLLPNYLAASHFPDALLNRIKAVPVGSRADTGMYRTRRREEESGTRRLILAVEDDGLEQLQSLIARPGRARSERQAFDEIRKFDRVAIAGRDEIVLGRTEEDAQHITWEAVLHPSTTIRGESEPLDARTMEKWFALVGEIGGQNHRDYVRRVGGLTFAPVVLAPSQIDELARFNPLRALRPMPMIRPRPRLATRVVSRLTPPTSGHPVEAGIRVAIFDGGVHSASSSPSLFPDQCTDVTPAAPDPDDLDHGTGVAGAAMYGLALPGTTAPQPPCSVDSYRVLPAPRIPNDLDGYWVLDKIKEIVIDEGYDIVNLSLGPELAVEDSIEPNRWTSELDQIAWEHDVLFVVAAGNDGDKDRDLGLHRVQIPGDMVNGLTVGACDVVPPGPQWGRTPYSSMGPGRHGNRIQPAGLQFGGTDTEPFPVICADGTFRDSQGTSFATPLVTHALSDLATRLPVATPSVLRAFAVHFAERHRTYKKLINEIGHGRIQLDFTSVLDSGPDEAHVLIVDTIDRGSLIGYQLPLPDQTNGPLTARITLAYISPVEPSEPTEYTRASLEMAFRPHYLMHRFTRPAGVSGPPFLVCDRTSSEALRLMSGGWSPSQEPVTKNLGAAPGSSEMKLRESGKWESIRHHRVSLAANEAQQPRLEVSYLARRAGSLDGSPSTVPFAVIVSIVDRSGGNDLHDRVRAGFPRLTSLPRNRAQVRAIRAQV